MGCFSGCLMSSASDQKLFCAVCLAFKCSFNEFVGEKVVSSSYSSAILVPPPIPLYMCKGYPFLRVCSQYYDGFVNCILNLTCFGVENVLYINSIHIICFLEVHKNSSLWSFDCMHWGDDMERCLTSLNIREMQMKTTMSFFNLLLLVGGWLLYNIVVVFAIHWHKSAMNPILIPPPASLPIPSLWVISVHQL